MATIEISSREFREKQKRYFELADKGEKIIVKRGYKKSYLITPIETEDINISTKMQEKIDNAIEQLRTGSVKKISGKEELINYLDSL